MNLAASLPPDDRRLSPITGWGREHWLYHADTLLAGARRHSSPDHARVRFPSTQSQDATDELEGFARTFLLGAIRIATGGAGQEALIDWYARALASGSDPAHPEAWPAITDHDQTLVEATAIALALHWSRRWLWPHLSPAVQERLVDWLSAGRDRWCADNNHVLFGATVEAFLASIGAAHRPEAIEAALARTEDFYAGDGWYSDGVGRRFDHYNAWTFHLYPFVIGELLGGGILPPVFEVYRSRLRMFCADYQHLFDAAGSPVLQGRSLTYRWGVLAPFWMAARHDCSPLSPGGTRRLTSGVVQHFTARGVGADGVLRLGWHGDTASVLQPYNAPGSPHWASKGFLGLLLPAEHPVWTATEQPLPVEVDDVAVPMAAPGWLAVGTRADGLVRLLNHGSDGHPQVDGRWYRRLAFSTATAPVEIDGLRDNVVDVPVSGRPARHRGLRGGRVRPTGGGSTYRLDAGRDVAVDVATTMFGALEVRLARLRGVIGLPVRVSGYPVAASGPLETEVTDGYARVGREDGLTSALGVLGCTASCPLRVDVRLAVADTPFGDAVGLPFAALDRAEQNEVLVAWWVRLVGSGSPVPLPADFEVRWLEDGAEVRHGGRRRRLRWTGDQGWPADKINQGVFHPPARAT